MGHKCHTMGCDVEVDPKMLMCKTHWFELPRADRQLVWKLYVPGQEITKTPSVAYVEAVQRIILRQAERLGLINNLKRICAGCLQEMPIRDNLDGEDLCQECCDKWVRGEGEFARDA